MVQQQKERVQAATGDKTRHQAVLAATAIACFGLNCVGVDGRVADALGRVCVAAGRIGGGAAVGEPQQRLDDGGGDAVVTEQRRAVASCVHAAAAGAGSSAAAEVPRRDAAVADEGHAARPRARGGSACNRRRARERCLRRLARGVVRRGRLRVAGQQARLVWGGTRWRRARGLRRGKVWQRGPFQGWKAGSGRGWIRVWHSVGKCGEGKGAVSTLGIVHAARVQRRGRCHTTKYTVVLGRRGGGRGAGGVGAPGQVRNVGTSALPGASSGCLRHANHAARVMCQLAAPRYCALPHSHLPHVPRQTPSFPHLCTPHLCLRQLSCNRHQVQRIGRVCQQQRQLLHRARLQQCAAARPRKCGHHLCGLPRGAHVPGRQQSDLRIPTQKVWGGGGESSCPQTVTGFSAQSAVTTAGSSAQRERAPIERVDHRLSPETKPVPSIQPGRDFAKPASPTNQQTNKSSKPSGWPASQTTSWPASQLTNRKAILPFGRPASQPPASQLSCQQVDQPASLPAGQPALRHQIAARPRDTAACRHGAPFLRPVRTPLRHAGSPRCPQAALSAAPPPRAASTAPAAPRRDAIRPIRTRRAAAAAAAAAPQATPTPSPRHWRCCPGRQLGSTPSEAAVPPSGGPRPRRSQPPQRRLRRRRPRGRECGSDASPAAPAHSCRRCHRRRGRCCLRPLVRGSYAQAQ
eukprot:357881-Chlamydomonas_euryale.AAC.13